MKKFMLIFALSFLITALGFGAVYYDTINPTGPVYKSSVTGYVAGTETVKIVCISDQTDAIDMKANSSYHYDGFQLVFTGWTENANLVRLDSSLESEVAAKYGSWKRYMEINGPSPSGLLNYELIYEDQ